jgi:uncharacterized protein YdhG (YjbR/CyaY superfamily)
MAGKRHEGVDAYIASYPPKLQAILRRLRRTIRAAAPDADERISYRIPTYTLGGNLVHFGAFKDHVSLFPTSSGVAAFKKQLARYECRAGTIRFPIDEPIPYDLIAQIVRFRVKEARSKRRRSVR